LAEALCWISMHVRYEYCEPSGMAAEVLVTGAVDTAPGCTPRIEGGRAGPDTVDGPRGARYPGTMTLANGRTGVDRERVLGIHSEPLGHARTRVADGRGARKRARRRRAPGTGPGRKEGSSSRLLPVLGTVAQKCPVEPDRAPRSTRIVSSLGWPRGSGPRRRWALVGDEVELSVVVLVEVGDPPCRSRSGDATSRGRMGVSRSINALRRFVCQASVRTPALGWGPACCCGCRRVAGGGVPCGGDRARSMAASGGGPVEARW